MRPISVATEVQACVVDWLRKYVHTDFDGSSLGHLRALIDYSALLRTSNLLAMASDIWNSNDLLLLAVRCFDRDHEQLYTDLSRYSVGIQESHSQSWSFDSPVRPIDPAAVAMLWYKIHGVIKTPVSAGYLRMGLAWRASCEYLYFGPGEGLPVAVAEALEVWCDAYLTEAVDSLQFWRELHNFATLLRRRGFSEDAKAVEKEYPLLPVVEGVQTPKTRTIFSVIRTALK